MSAVFPKIHEQCAGRWTSILALIGIDEAYLSGRHGPCPVCNDGKDRFRWDRKREFSFCSSCGHKSPLDLAIAYLRRDFKSTAVHIRSILGVTTMEPVKQTDDTAKNQARIDRIKAGLKPLTGQCIASRYLAGRGLRVLPVHDCYFHPSIAYYNEGEKVGDYPAMVSIFRNIEGKGATFHITYLTSEGKKADFPSPKKILPTVLPLSGCAIRLFNPEQGVLAIAEGIETALSIVQMEGVPCWASGNAGNMAAMQVPADVTEVWIYADNDENFVGQHAAFTLAKRLKNEGKKVFVEIPKAVGDDFLDEMLESRAQSENAARS